MEQQICICDRLTQSYILCEKFGAVCLGPMGSGLNFSDIVDQNYTYVVQLGLMVGRLNEKEFFKTCCGSNHSTFHLVYPSIQHHYSNAGC